MSLEIVCKMKGLCASLALLLALLLPWSCQARLIVDPRPYLLAEPIRIYVYDETSHPAIRELTKVRSSKKYGSKCARSMWGEEFRLHDQILGSPIRTRDPTQADFFYIPVFSKCDSISFRSKLTERVLLQVLSASPFFARSGGRDHFVLFPSGSGPHFLSNWTRYFGETIFLMAESHFSSRGSARAPYFHPFKDIVVPGFLGSTKLKTLSEAGEASPQPQRKRLACFAGSIQGLPSRRAIMRLSSQFPEDVFSFNKKFPTFQDYASNLAQCRFCLIPRGQSAWTLRFFESLFLECVPVIVNNFLQMPFESLIDYTAFTVKWPAERVDASLVAYLKGVGDAERERAVERMREVRCLLQWHDVTPGSASDRTLPLASDPSCSALLGVLYELGKRRLTGLRHSASAFWALGEGARLRARDGSDLLGNGSLVDGRFEVLDIYGRRPKVCQGCDQLPITCRQEGPHMVCRGRGHVTTSMEATAGLGAEEDGALETEEGRDSRDAGTRGEREDGAASDAASDGDAQQQTQLQSLLDRRRGSKASIERGAGMAEGFEALAWAGRAQAAGERINTADSDSQQGVQVQGGGGAGLRVEVRGDGTVVTEHFSEERGWSAASAKRLGLAVDSLGRLKGRLAAGDRGTAGKGG